MSYDLKSIRWTPKVYASSLFFLEGISLGEIWHFFPISAQDTADIWPITSVL